MSAAFVDLPALAQSLQQLPLHQRLNLEAELLQVPVSLLQIKTKPLLQICWNFYTYLVLGVHTCGAANSDPLTETGEAKSLLFHSSTHPQHQQQTSDCSCKSSVRLRPKGFLSLCRACAAAGCWWRAGSAAQFTETRPGCFRKPECLCVRGGESGSRERWEDSAGSLL